METQFAITPAGQVVNDVAKIGLEKQLVVAAVDDGKFVEVAESPTAVQLVADSVHVADKQLNVNAKAYTPIKSTKQSMKDITAAIFPINQCQVVEKLVTLKQDYLEVPSTTYGTGEERKTWSEQFEEDLEEDQINSEEKVNYEQTGDSEPSEDAINLMFGKDMDDVFIGVQENMVVEPSTEAQSGAKVQGLVDESSPAMHRIQVNSPVKFGHKQ